jgi:hypothetical protein
MVGCAGALGLVLFARPAATADKEIRPFLAVKFGVTNTFIDFDSNADRPKVLYGVTADVLSDVFGADVDFSDGPGFYSGASVSSRVTTLTGNLVVAFPRHLNQYGLRPYITGGGGLLRVRIDDSFNAIPIAEILPAMDVGGGVTGYFTKRVGVSWELRRFQSLRSSTDPGISLGAARLSFWRANMALALRY